MYTTRIAPSPTGDMHFGTVRTAYFNYLVARSSGGKFILRIDDTDLDRNKEECVKVIYETMYWLGLNPDITFRQSERTKRYHELLEALTKSGAAVELANGAIALRCGADMPKLWKDEISGDVAITETNIKQINGGIEYKGKVSEGLILAREDGTVTYQFASVCDDWDYGVNYIIRGTDHTTNTPKQIAIWLALNDACCQDLLGKTPDGDLRVGIDLSKFAHIGLIFKDKKKLSKRDNAASMLYYRDKGYHPDAILNAMLRLGWGPKIDDKSNAIISRDRAIKMFLTEGRMKNSIANLDTQKLDWFDREYKKCSM